MALFEVNKALSSMRRKNTTITTNDSVVVSGNARLPNVEKKKKNAGKISATRLLWP
jgi:hypothetical protein